LGHRLEVPATRHALPTSLVPEDLNQLLQQLLEAAGKPTARRFEFVVEGELLQGSLKSHLVKVGKVAEKNVEIWYSSFFGKPEIDNSVDVTNGVARLFYAEDPATLLGCTHNNTVHLFGASLEDKGQLAVKKTLDSLGETTLAFEWNETLSKSLLLASNNFGDFAICELSADCQKVVQTHVESSNSPVSTLSLNPLANTLFVTGDHEGSLRIWEKEEGSGLVLRGEKSGAHAGPVLKSLWASSTEIYSAGFDDAFKVFDCQALVNTYFIYFKDSLATTFEVNQSRKALLTGHVGGSIRLFDDQARNKTTQKVFKSHSTYVSAIKINPFDNQVFASADFGGKVKVWDFRTELPLFTIDAHGDDKVFDLVWTGCLIRRKESVFWRSRWPNRQARICLTNQMGSFREPRQSQSTLRTRRGRLNHSSLSTPKKTDPCNASTGAGALTNPHFF
jgi:ribosome biogenesis protein YTM1